MSEQAFELRVKEWVAVDNEIKQHNSELKELRMRRNSLSDDIMEIATDKKLIDKTIMISDGKLKFQTSNHKAPINLKFIRKCLLEKIESEENVNILMDYINEQREVKQVRDIKRYYSS